MTREALITHLKAWAATIESERRANELLDWNDLEQVRALLLEAADKLTIRMVERRPFVIEED